MLSYLEIVSVVVPGKSGRRGWIVGPECAVGPLVVVAAVGAAVMLELKYKYVLISLMYVQYVHGLNIFEEKRKSAKLFFLCIYLPLFPSSSLLYPSMQHLKLPLPLLFLGRGEEKRV